MRQSSRFVLTSICIAALTACGGGGNDSSSSGGGATTNVTLQGKVAVVKALANAKVCLDLNANDQCDTGEPSSTSSASGDYQFSATTAQLATAGASLIALVAAGEVTAKPYVMRQPPNQNGAQINPLTTLVAAGVKAGMTEANARANIATQLGIDAAKIDNYLDDPEFDDNQVRDNARTAAAVTASALEDGAALQVGDQSAAITAAAGDLLQLRYGGVNGYFYRTVANNAKAAGSASATYSDLRTQVSSGTAVTDTGTLYPNIFLTSTGWQRCDANSTHATTPGNPSRSVYCGVNTSVGFKVEKDIAGQTMSAVITSMQASTRSNTLNNGLAVQPLLDAVGSATFPAGSKAALRTNLSVTPYYFINSNSDFRPQAEATTLDELIAAKPASAVNLTTTAGSLSLGITTSSLRNLRVAFTGTTNATSGTVQFYECDLSADGNTASNCTATTTGAYAITTVNGVRIMGFSGHGDTSASSQVNFYGEINTSSSGPRVARVRQNKLTTVEPQEFAVSYANRLNATAWAALRAQLGL